MCIFVFESECMHVCICVCKIVMGVKSSGKI